VSHIDVRWQQGESTEIELCHTILGEVEMERISRVIRAATLAAALSLLISTVTGVGLSRKSGEEMTASAVPAGQMRAAKDFTHTVFMEDGSASW